MFKNPLTQDINPSKIATDYKGDLERMVPTIDIAFVGKLLSDVFGVESPVYLPTWWQGRDYNAPAYPGIALKADEPEDADAPVRFGQKTYGAFWLEGGQYLKWDEYGGGLVKGSYSKFLMPLATLVDFSQPKNVVKTPVVGGRGTVKEIYGLDDWNISIKGIIIPDENNPPAFRTVEGQMYAMQQFSEIAGSINVSGKIFANRIITRMVIESLTFSPIQGRPNMMQYTMEAVSDIDELSFIPA